MPQQKGTINEYKKLLYKKQYTYLKVLQLRYCGRDSIIQVRNRPYFHNETWISYNVPVVFDLMLINMFYLQKKWKTDSYRGLPDSLLDGINEMMREQADSMLMAAIENVSCSKILFKLFVDFSLFLPL